MLTKEKAFYIRKLFFIAAFLFYACLLGYSVLEETFTKEFSFGESKVEVYEPFKVPGDLEDHK